jgi:hypothetical protein
MKVMRKSPIIRTHHTYHGAIRTDGSGNVTAGGTTACVGCINYPLFLVVKKPFERITPFYKQYFLVSSSYT